MEVIYRAFDGNEFFEEEECELYERRMLAKEYHFDSKAWDEDGDPISFIGEDGRIREEVHYIECVSVADAAQLYKMYDDEGLSSPWDLVYRQFNYNFMEERPSLYLGRFYYDKDIGEWMNFENLESQYLTIRNVFENEG